MRNQWFMSEDEAKVHVERFCGDPPDIKKVEYLIWLNKLKLEFSQKRVGNFLKGDDKEFYVRSLKKMVNAAENLLATIQQ